MSEPAGEAGLELGMVLEVAFPTVPTLEPAATPNQRRATAAHPKVTNPLRSPVPHPSTLEPALAAPRPLPSRFDLHLKTINRIDPHPPHANTRQVQTNGHNIRHRGLSWIGDLAIHRFQRGLTPNPRISPHPTHISAQGRHHRRQRQSRGLSIRPHSRRVGL